VLLWKNQSYVLQTPNQAPLVIQPEDETIWQNWLETHTSFSFQGQYGNLNVYKETRSRGSGYWYAYRGYAGRIRKRYLGRSAALTFALLEEVARVLQEPPQTSASSTPAHHPPASDTRLSTVVTRLSPPRLPSTLVKRNRLLLALDSALTRPLTLLSASAGWGKTTLLTAWIHHSRSRYAWVSLEELDNDPIRFWITIISALRTCLPGVGARALTLLQTTTPLTTCITALLNELAESTGEPVVLILDDYHVIEEPAIHTSLLFWLEHLPPTLHLILASRIDPEFPLSRLRVRGHLDELRDSDLRFTREETHHFLTQCMGLMLSEDESAVLATRTEGWIASLQLAALILQKQVNPAASLHTLNGSHRFLLNYIREEILANLPQQLQLFLLQTSGLSRLNTSLCNAVTGRNDSDLLLEQVLGANLFLQALDGEQQWYRYHSLWALSLQHEARHRLGEHALRELASRESRWYEAQGLLPEAIEAAITARDYAFAAELIERLVTVQSFRNPYSLLRRWLEQIPDEVFTPSLHFLHAETLLFTSSRRDPSTRELIERPLHIAEQGFREQQATGRLAEVLSVRAIQAFFQHDLATAFSLARQMLELQPANVQHWRGSSLGLLSVEKLFAGEIEQALSLMLEARSAYIADQSLPGLIMAAFLLGEIHVGQGALHQAERYYQQVLSGDQATELHQHQLTTATGEQETYFIQQAYYGLALLSYERNRLDAARQWLAQAQDNKPTEEMGFVTPGTLLQARILLACGQSEQAQEYLRSRAIQARTPQFLRKIRACEARIALETGDLSRAEEWAQTVSGTEPPDFLLRQEEEALLLVRLRLAQGKPAVALRLLEPWKTRAEQQRRIHSLLEILLLEARILHALHRTAEAVQNVRTVVTRAKAEGYQRLFLDEGPTVKHLLEQLYPELHEPTLTAYVRSLQTAFKPDGCAPSLPEPLSEQEVRVLRLLVVGRSNPEIARELFVSINTVKTHIQSIYRKLNVHNRHKAGEVARALALL